MAETKTDQVKKEPDLKYDEGEVVLDCLIDPELAAQSQAQSGNGALLRPRKNSITSQKAEISCLKRTWESMLKYSGYFYGVSSAFLMAITNVFIKKVKIFTGSDQTLVRYVIQFVCMAIVLKYNKLPFIGARDIRIPLLIRGTVGVVGLTTVHFSVKLIDPSDTLAVFNSSILVTAIFSRIFLKEKLSFAHIIAIILAVSGIVLISQPSFIFPSRKAAASFLNSSDPVFQGNISVACINSTLANCTGSTSSGDANGTVRLLGIGLALLGAVASGIVPVVIKHLSNHHVHFSLIIIYAAYFGIPICTLISIVMWIFGKGTRDMTLFKDPLLLTIQLFYSILSAVAGLLSQILWNLALRHEDPSKVSVMRSLDLFFVFFQQYIFLGISSNIYSISGAAMIFLGALIIIVYKILDKKYSIKSAPKTTNHDELKDGEKPLNDGVNRDANEETDAGCSKKGQKRILLKKVVFYKI